MPKVSDRPQVYLTVEMIDALTAGIKALKTMANDNQKAVLEAARSALQTGKGNYMKRKGQE